MDEWKAAGRIMTKFSNYLAHKGVKLELGEALEIGIHLILVEENHDTTN